MKFIDLGPKWQRYVTSAGLANLMTCSYGQTDGAFYAVLRFAFGTTVHDVRSVPFTKLEDAHAALSEAVAKLSPSTI